MHSAFRITIIFLLFATSYVFSKELSEDFIKQFAEYAEKERIAWEIPGMAIGIVKGDKILLLKGFGTRGLNDSKPVDEETIFQIGSLSKAFTSALAAISVDKGLLKWEDKVFSRLPSFLLFDPWVSREFEIYDLFAQRSGLPPYAGDSQAFLGFNEQEMIDHLRFIEPQSSFRSKFAYQNIFFVVGSEILTRIYNLSFKDLLKREIFDPLEMAGTTATLEDYLKAPNKAEWLIRKKGGETVPLGMDFPYRDWNYVLGAAGGINSNIKDMVKWITLQTNLGRYKGKQLISADNMKLMHRPAVYMGDVFDHPSYYAEGWVHISYSPYPIIFHNGATLGVYNAAAIMPEEKLGIVVLSNVRETQLSHALILQFFDLYFGKENQDWSGKILKVVKAAPESAKKNPLPGQPALPLELYAGSYTSPIYGEAVVSVKDGTLHIRLGKNHTQFDLQHWERDIFKFKWTFIDEEGSFVLFYPNSSGNIETMEIEPFKKEGGGVFKKQAM